jgi:hypothetical protein
MTVRPVANEVTFGDCEGIVLDAFHVLDLVAHDLQLKSGRNFVSLAEGSQLTNHLFDFLFRDGFF